MRRKPKGKPDAPLAPVPSEILDQFVRQGPLSSEELDAAVRRFKKAIIERALGGELTRLGPASHCGDCSSPRASATGRIPEVLRFPTAACSHRPGEASSHRPGACIGARVAL